MYFTQIFNRTELEITCELIEYHNPSLKGLLNANEVSITFLGETNGITEALVRGLSKRLGDGKKLSNYTKVYYKRLNLELLSRYSLMLNDLEKLTITEFFNKHNLNFDVNQYTFQLTKGKVKFIIANTDNLSFVGSIGEKGLKIVSLEDWNFTINETKTNSFVDTNKRLYEFIGTDLNATIENPKETGFFKFKMEAPSGGFWGTPWGSHVTGDSYVSKICSHCFDNLTHLNTAINYKSDVLLNMLYYNGTEKNYLGLTRNGQTSNSYYSYSRTVKVLDFYYLDPVTNILLHTRPLEKLILNNTRIE